MDENVRADNLLYRIEHARVGRQVVGPAVEEVRVARLKGVGAGAELLAKAFMRAAKHAVSSFDKTRMGNRIPSR